MFKNILKVGGYSLLGLLVLVVIGVGYLLYRLQDSVYAEYTGDRTSVLEYFDEAPPEAAPEVAGEEEPAERFDPERFQQPGAEFGPWTRWWWPGNDVEPEELRREIRVLAENGFAGVEIQPFTMGLDSGAPHEQQARVYSYDTEAFFENLRVVMEAAKEAGLQVDLNAAGGWPSGGPHIKPGDNFKMLVYSEETVQGGREVSLELPKPEAPFPYYVLSGMGVFFGGRMLAFFQDEADLVEVVAARVVEDQRSSLLWKTDDQVVLDPAGVQLLRDRVDSNGVLTWDAPEGPWRLVALWSMPAGEAPTLIPSRDRGFVVDHLDARRVIAHYNYLFGKRSGLAPYYGNPFRAIFNDSYEFKVERHFTPNFIEEFEKRRGYDLRPWLPAMMRPGYDNFMFSLFVASTTPEFRFSDEDERVNYDYSLTVSDLFIENFIDTSSEWMAHRGLRNRTQAYGTKFDVIKASGHARIPETEQLYSEGAEMFLKIVSSGAQLYNRPVITSESVVFMGRDYMTTPQKIKIAVDKLVTSGVNQVIYHGTPYKYPTEAYGEEGWNPWSNALIGEFISFSSNVSESDAYWKYQKEVNSYIARSQYAVRRGKPSTDVLIYYPFLGMDFHHGKHEELLYRGVLEDVEPPLRLPAMLGADEASYGESTVWLEEAWKAIQELDRQGISWAWVNDDSLQTAAWQDNAIGIRGNRYQAVFLLKVPYIQVASAERLSELAVQGARVVVLGDAPERQPGYLNYQENDGLVQQYFQQILAAETAMQLEQPGELAELRERLSQAVAYAEAYPYLKHLQRELPDGSRVVFFRNMSNDDVRFRLLLDSRFRHAYWLSPGDGSMHAVDGGLNEVEGTLGPYGSAVLYASVREAIPARLLSEPPALKRFAGAEPVQALEQWDLQAGDVSRASTNLFDWRDDPELRYSPAVGVYSCTFTLPEKQEDTRYLLDLGRVYFTADVNVNGEAVASLLFAPYRVDVTDYLEAGENRIEVSVTATQRNGYIGRGLAGEEAYARFEGQQDAVMAAGLAGPARVFAIR